jgi:hypothetical protein
MDMIIRDSKDKLVFNFSQRKQGDPVNKYKKRDKGVVNMWSTEKLFSMLYEMSQESKSVSNKFNILFATAIATVSEISKNGEVSILSFLADFSIFQSYIEKNLLKLKKVKDEQMNQDISYRVKHSADLVLYKLYKVRLQLITIFYLNNNLWPEVKRGGLEPILMPLLAYIGKIRCKMGKHDIISCISFIREQMTYVSLQARGLLEPYAYHYGISFNYSSPFHNKALLNAFNKHYPADLVNKTGDYYYIIRLIMKISAERSTSAFDQNRSTIKFNSEQWHQFNCYYDEISRLMAFFTLSDCDKIDIGLFARYPSYYMNFAFEEFINAPSYSNNTFGRLLRGLEVVVPGFWYLVFNIIDTRQDNHTIPPKDNLSPDTNRVDQELSTNHRVNATATGIATIQADQIKDSQDHMDNGTPSKPKIKHKIMDNNENSRCY